MAIGTATAVQTVRGLDAVIVVLKSLVMGVGVGAPAPCPDHVTRWSSSPPKHVDVISPNCQMWFSSGKSYSIGGWSDYWKLLVRLRFSQAPAVLSPDFSASRSLWKFHCGNGVLLSVVLQSAWAVSLL